MSATTFNQTKNLNPAKLVTSGAIAGLAGGMVFGIMMAMMGMLPMIAGLVRSQSAFVGFIVHMFISAFIGAIYGLVAGRFPLTWLNAVIGGMLNGVVWWVLGALILMPIGLGMTNMVFHVGTDQWFSLMGHLIYGLVTAFVFVPLAKRH
jgi:uncharacterized membrane protein YagU involved in acid resistance